MDRKGPEIERRRPPEILHRLRFHGARALKVCVSIIVPIPVLFSQN